MKTRGVPDSHPNPPGWNPSHPGGGGGRAEKDLPEIGLAWQLRLEV